MIHFDPVEISAEKIIDEIKDAEDSITSIEDMVIDSRIIYLPISLV
mgnify:FL=1